MRKETLAVAAVAILALTATGCATKKYVNGEVAGVNQRVDGVQGQVEDNQTTLRDHEGRIVHNAEAAAAASKTAQEALERAVAAGKLAEGKLLYETVLSDEAKAALDAFANDLKSANKNVYVEIQGHTDNVGGENYNEQLGKKRAQAVMEYLAKAGIPIFRMATISYGESAPVADNSSREGRAANRRVVLVVLQ